MTDHNKDLNTSDLVDSLKQKEKISVLFVCLGNICRSPAAEGIFRDIVERRGESDRYEIDSAGLYSGHAGDLPDRRMRLHAFQRGYNLTHHARPVRERDFDDFDLILSMDDSNYSRLRAFAPSAEAERKVIRTTDFCRRHPGATHVPDPYYEGAEGFEIVLDMLEDACQGLADALDPKE